MTRTTLIACTRVFGGGRLMTTLQRKLDELDESILADQRMVKAPNAWTTCMRAATGQDHEDSVAVEVDLRGGLGRIVGPPLPNGQVAPDGTYDKATLTALQREELELTSHDVACERDHITPVETVVRKEKERTSPDANAELLSKVRPLGSRPDHRTTKGPRKARALHHIKPAASYSPRPLRAKYHRR